MTTVLNTIACLLLYVTATRASCYSDCTSNKECNASDPTTCKTCAFYNTGTPYKCQPLTTYCGTKCAGQGDCDSYPYGTCTFCNSSGFCQKPPNTCGQDCKTSETCTGLECQACVDGKCAHLPSMCNATCAERSDCQSSDPNQECFACVEGSCIAPVCGIPCKSINECGGSKIGECQFCIDGECAVGKTCGMECDPNEPQCTGDCFLCSEQQGGGDNDGNKYVCAKPTPQPHGCGQYCGAHGYDCPQKQGDCTYCNLNTCTTYDDFLAQEKEKAAATSQE